MGLTRDDLIGEMSDEERRIRKSVLDRYISNDEWAINALKNTAILLTSHPGNRAYLKASVETHKKLGLWLCVAYDNYFDPKQSHIDYNLVLPAKDVMDNIDTFVMPHHQTWGGVSYPYFWLLKFGVNTLQDFEYIYCTNGDFILEKPEGFGQLFSLLGDGDIMTTGPDYANAANTAGFIAKSSVLRKIVKHMQDHFIPFDVYEKHTQNIGNTEGRFGRAIKDLNLKKIEVLPPLGPDGNGDDMFKYNPKQRKQNGTWYDLIGFRHIHAELNYAYRNKEIPPEPKYFDERYTSANDMRAMKAYAESNDISVLKDWWCR